MQYRVIITGCGGEYKGKKPPGGFAPAVCVLCFIFSAHFTAECHDACPAYSNAVVISTTASPSQMYSQILTGSCVAFGEDGAGGVTRRISPEGVASGAVRMKVSEVGMTCVLSDAGGWVAAGPPPTPEPSLVIGAAAISGAAAPKDRRPSRLVPRVKMNSSIATTDAHENTGTRRGTRRPDPGHFGRQGEVAWEAPDGCAAENGAGLAQVYQRGGKRRVQLQAGFQAPLFSLRQLPVQGG